MNAKLTLFLLVSAAACSHRSETAEATAADRTVVTINRGQERGHSTAQSDTPSKREPLQSASEARAKTEAVTPGTRLTESGNTEVVEPLAADTGKNARDWDDKTATPLDQSNSERDLTITQQIRRAVMGDETLSFTAKNVKIITSDGKVTLRGPVNSASERATIDNFARRIAGERAVDNQLEVTP